VLAVHRRWPSIIHDAVSLEYITSRMSTTDALRPGLTGTAEILVGTRDTAPHIGSGKIKVLATPVLVSLMEEAALSAVEGLLPAGHQTVGTRLDITHVAATPVGLRVKATAEVTRIEGRRVTFRVWADDEGERIGEGTHERIVVEVERFDRRAQAKVPPRG
jgi:predicted thioesterase